LALWQTHHVRDVLTNHGHEVELVMVKTVGDIQTDRPLHQLGAQGLFTKALDDAMLDGLADISVHSAKDIPTKLPDGIGLLAVLEREDPRDVLLAIRPEVDLDNFTEQFSVGTSSIRRQALLSHYAGHFQPKDIRGNLDTRVAKLEAGEYDALLLAYAGVKRMGYTHLVRRKLNVSTFTPAVGQGAIAITGKLDFGGWGTVRGAFNHEATESAVLGERAFLRLMEGGCHAAVFALGTVIGTNLSLHGGVASPDGKVILRNDVEGPARDAEVLGESLASIIIKSGGHQILHG
jgi:hydroxymethylbilane synthase